MVPVNRQLPLCLLQGGGRGGTSGPAMGSREAPNGCLVSVDHPSYMPASRSCESSSYPRSLENPLNPLPSTQTPVEPRGGS